MHCHYTYGTGYEIFNECFPLNTKVISEKYACNPWMTPAVLKSIRRKNKLFMDYRLGLIDELLNKQYRNLLNKIITNAMKNFYAKVFSEYKSNVKIIWKHINDLKNTISTKNDSIQLKIDNKLMTNSSDIASYFNNYFSKIGQELDSKLEHTDTDPLNYLQGNFPNSLSIPPILQTYFTCYKKIEKQK